MAYREYTLREFEAELRDTFKLERIGPETEGFERWRTRKGHTVLVPVLPLGVPYPHYLVGEIGQDAERLDSP